MATVLFETSISYFKWFYTKKTTALRSSSRSFDVHYCRYCKLFLFISCLFYVKVMHFFFNFWIFMSIWTYVAGWINWGYWAALLIIICCVRHHLFQKPQLLSLRTKLLVGFFSLGSLTFYLIFFFFSLLLLLNLEVPDFGKK